MVQLWHRAFTSDKPNILLVRLVYPILLGEAWLLSIWLHIWLTQFVAGVFLGLLVFDTMQHTLLLSYVGVASMFPRPCNAAGS